MIQGPKSRNFLYIGPVWRIRDYMRKRYKGIFCVVASHLPAWAMRFGLKYIVMRVFTAVNFVRNLMEDLR